MENKRKDLAEALELVGGVFDIDGMAELAAKAEKAAKEQASQARILAISYKMEALLMQKDPGLADRLVAWHMGKSVEEAAQLEDAEYGRQLRDTVVADVCGFFGLSPRTDGTK